MSEPLGGALWQVSPSAARPASDFLNPTLGTITNLTATATDHETVALAWTPPAGAVLQSVERSDDAGANWTPIGTALAGTVGTYTDRDLTEGTDYIYRVRVTGVSGTTPTVSNEAPVTTPAAPAVTTKPTVTNAVAWALVSELSGYADGDEVTDFAGFTFPVGRRPVFRATGGPMGGPYLEFAEGDGGTSSYAPVSGSVLLAVWRAGDVGLERRVFNTANYLMGHDGTNYLFRPGGASEALPGDAVDVSRWLVQEGVTRGDLTSEHFIDNGSEGTGTIVSAAQNISLGWDAARPLSFVGGLAGVLIVDGAYDPTERGNVNAYLQTRFGIDLGSGSGGLLGTTTNLVATAAGANGANLSWTPAANNTGQTPQRSTSASGPWTDMGAIGPSIGSASVFSLSASTTYYFRIIATNGASTTTSNVASATTADPAASATWHTTTWVGNTLPGINFRHIPTMDGFTVRSDGTVMPNAIYSESGNQGQHYKAGALTGYDPGFHGYGMRGGLDIAHNTAYIYAAAYMANDGALSGDQYYVGLQRFHNSAPFNGAGGFSGGIGPDGARFLAIATPSWGADPDGSVTGIACNDSWLYVSDPFAGLVRRFDASSMAASGTVAVADPSKMAVAPDGTLWVISGTSILHYSADLGTLLHTVTSAGTPTALAFDAAGRLMVADAGTRQQILFYGTSGTPAIVATFGDAGGVYSGTRGVVGATRLEMPNAVGMDASGNLYVNNGAGAADLRCYSPTGTLLWQLEARVFMDTGGILPGSAGTDLFTIRDRWTVDYSRSNGREFTRRALTLDALSYPDDPRLHPDLWLHPAVYAVRSYLGQTFVWVLNQEATYFHCYRLTGELLKWCVGLSSQHVPGFASGQQPASGRWIWRDANGDHAFTAGEFVQDGLTDNELFRGWDVDTDMRVWRSRGTTLEVYRPAAALDAQSNPVYSYTAGSGAGQLQTWAVPSLFTDRVERILYDAANDRLYLSGWASPSSAIAYGRAGNVLARFDGWLAGNNGAGATPAWTLALPYDNSTLFGGEPYRAINAWDVAGDYLFIGNLNGVVTGGVAPVDNPPAGETIVVHKVSDGTRLTSAPRSGALWPGSEVGGNANWIDMAHGVRAFRRPGGEYVVRVEELSQYKVLVYRGMLQP